MLTVCHGTGEQSCLFIQVHLKFCNFMLASVSCFSVAVLGCRKSLREEGAFLLFLSPLFFTSEIEGHKVHPGRSQLFLCEVPAVRGTFSLFVEHCHFAILKIRLLQLLYFIFNGIPSTITKSMKIYKILNNSNISSDFPFLFI